MRDIVERYGFQVNRGGFINCPFHNERTASLKVYQKDFHCFGCHTHGDIFTFIMKMDDCSFKDAVKSLGGETGRMSDAAITRMRRRKREAERHRKRLSDALCRVRSASWELHYWKDVLSVIEPFSDIWCDIQNLLPKVRCIADEAVNSYMDILDEGR